MGEANNLYNKVYPALPEIAKPDVGLAGKIPESAQVTPEPPKMNKKEVIASIRETVASFTKLREAGEGVGVGATMVQGTILTSGGIVAGVTAGGTVVAGAALAFPLTAAIAAVGVIVGVILRQTALNQELRVNLIMIKGEVERIYNIYKVMEEIAKEKQLPINTDMVKKFTIILTNNILLAAGPDTFEKIKVMSLGEG